MPFLSAILGVLRLEQLPPPPMVGVRVSLKSWWWFREMARVGVLVLVFVRVGSASRVGAWLSRVKEKAEVVAVFPAPSVWRTW